MSPTCHVEFPETENSHNTGEERAVWAKSIIQDSSKVFSEDEHASFHPHPLPDLVVVIKDDKTSQLLAQAHDGDPYQISNLDSHYSSRFRIPPATLLDLSDKEKECHERAQRFAIGSLLYTIMTGKEPFSDLDDSLVQENFEKGVYPADTIKFPIEIAIPILGCWSQEFAQHFNQITQESLTNNTSPASRILDHVKAHPISSGITVAGLVTFGIVSLVNPVLGIAGFSALGPTVGSAAAAWQSSIGLVQAGSFFAWCQSVAMGGAAAGAIAATQGVAAGVGVAGLAALGSATLSDSSDEIWTMFSEKVRKAEQMNE